MSDTSGTPNITSTDTTLEEVPTQNPGVEDGEVVTSTVPAESGGKVKEVQERIVYDYEVDEDGNSVLDRDGNPILVGWHKEAVNG